MKMLCICAFTSDALNPRALGAWQGGLQKWIPSVVPSRRAGPNPQNLETFVSTEESRLHGREVARFWSAIL
eukprot:5846660-Alexandrium_andersonii.AAC.1